MWTVAVFAILTILCFLYVLNLYLRGASRALTETSLAVLIIGTDIAAFFLLGWELGVAAVLATFPLTWLLRPLARRTARQILGFRTGIVESSTSGLEWERFLSGRGSFQDAMQASEKEREKNNKNLGMLADCPEVRAVLGRHGVSVEGYEGLHDDLRSCGVEEDLKWETLSNPMQLEALISMREEGKTPMEIAWEIRKLG